MQELDTVQAAKGYGGDRHRGTRALEAELDLELCAHCRQRLMRKHARPRHGVGVSCTG